ncbi:MAG: FAD-dependent oxidoreductase, partial [Oleiphilaceae bacterium]|nr:FAD-dependent oxidoreductase [Oleiphilaceae bacterium]
MSAKAVINLRTIAGDTPALGSDYRVAWQYLIVGAGPVGMRAAQEILSLDPQAKVRVIGQENVMPYDRIKLTSLLAGDVKRPAIDLALPDVTQHPNFEFIHGTASHIDRDERLVIDELGRVHEYDKLILATGSRAHVPDVPGITCDGVYRLRSLRDTEELFARLTRSRHIVVVGGGLLGIEAAKALLRSNTHVTLIHQGPYLMNRLLHEAAAKALQAELKALGIYVICNAGVRKIHGEQRVSGVRTRDGNEIKCDSVLLCTGIRPNIDLARKSGVKVAQGIVVDDHLATSDPDIFAIGECCEHRGATYGLVGPGYEQAAVLARSLHAQWQHGARIKPVDASQQADGEASTEQHTYAGSHALTRLKVLNESVCSMGEVVDLPRRPFQSEIDFSRKKAGSYRRVVLYRGRIIGFAGLGEWPELPRLQQAYLDEQRLWPWQTWWFRLSGRLWLRLPTQDVNQWSADTIVCQCNRLSKGSLCDAIGSGCDSMAALQSQTRAGTVCGSCQPLLSDLITEHSGKAVTAEPERDGRVALGAGVLALILLAVFMMMPSAQVADSVQTQSWYERIWNDGFWKQVTGFSLLGLSLIGLLMSLRKRLGWAWMGQFAAWRGAHVVIGVLCLGMLALHTGLHMGVNLNRWLLVDFLLVLGLGGLS